jgi:DNA primase
MNVVDLKQYILDNDKVGYILDELGCHDTKEFKKEYRSGLPEHSNKTAIAINNETLSTKIFQSDDKIIRGDIVTLVMHIKNFTFTQANKWLHGILGLAYEFNFKNENQNKMKDSPLDIFRKIKKHRNRYNVRDIEFYGEDILDEFVPYPHISLIREDGIMPWTCEEFNIGYSPKHKRILFPERYWCGDKNTYVGIMGRTIIKEYEMLDIAKYFPLKAFPKGLNLYGLNENYKKIQESGYVVVLEGQKGVLKRHSRNDKTCVACGSHDLSDEQVKILISLNVDVVIAFDKDVSLHHVRATCNKFYGIRNVYYMYDKWDILGKKDSPADLSDKIYKFMFKHKIKFDEKEKKMYNKNIK